MSIVQMLRNGLIRVLYLLPALVMRALGWRLIRVTNVHRIGHLTPEIDCLIKEERLGLFPPLRGLLLAPRGAVANEHMVTYWSHFIRTVRSPLLCKLLAPVNRFRFVRMREDMSCYIAAINSTAAYNKVEKLWGGRPPLLTLTAEDTIRGEQALRALGVPSGARFVCFHSRDGGYSTRDEALHSFRNSSVENYLVSASALVEKGFYCIRLGDPTMKKLPEISGIIDYAHSALRSDWMDIFLCARCEFFLGNTSGLFFVPNAFGRPVCLANMIPISNGLPFRPGDIGIPKLIWDRNEQRLLTFPEIFASDIANFRYTYLYEERGIEPMESAPEDIRDMALEMLARTQGIAAYDQEDEVLQRRFHALMQPGHYSYGSAARIGRDFLRKYAHLLTQNRINA